MTNQPMLTDRPQPGKGSYSAIVYIDGSQIVAEDADGKTIARSVAGIADDKVIQTAIAYAAGSKVFIKPGTYYITASLVPNADGLWLMGEGKNTILKIKNNSITDQICPIIWIMDYPAHSSSYSDIIVSNLTLDGNKANQAPTSNDARYTALGVWIERGSPGTGNYLLESLWVHDCWSGGIYLEEEVGAYPFINNNTILNNIFTYNNGVDISPSIAGSGRSGIHVDQMRNAILTNIQSYNNVGAGIYINYGIHIIGDQIITFGNGKGTTANKSSGLRLASGCYGCRFANLASYGDYYGILLMGGAATVEGSIQYCDIQATIISSINGGVYGDYVYNSKIDSIVKESGDNGIYLDHGSDNIFRGISSENLAYHGIQVSTNGQYNTFDNMIVKQNQRNGIYLIGSNNRILGGVVANNSQASTLAYNEIFLNTATNCMIRNVKTYSTLVAKTAYSIFETGSADYNYFIDNILNSGYSGIIYKKGTHSVVKSNQGYITESSGSSTITAGSKYATVTHGLAITPTLDQIMISWADNIGGRTVWIDNIGGTTFRVNLSSADTVNHTFGWKVI